jgi:hypothetical protein
VARNAGDWIMVDGLLDGVEVERGINAAHDWGPPL